jgi:hypothetical protein
MDNVKAFIKRAKDSGTSEGTLVAEHLDGLLAENADTDLVTSSLLEIRGWATAALNAMVGDVLHDAMVQKARDAYASDDVYVNDGAWVDPVENGSWVEAMVFVPKE